MNQVRTGYPYELGAEDPFLDQPHHFAAPPRGELSEAEELEDFRVGCPSCGVPRNDPNHLRLEWGALVGQAEAGLPPFWQAALLYDAFNPDSETGPIRTEGANALAETVRVLPLESAQSGITITLGRTMSEQAGDALPPPPPEPDYRPGAPDWDSLPEGAVALSGLMWAEVSPGVWKWVLMWHNPDKPAEWGYLVVPPAPVLSSWCCCPLKVSIRGHKRGSGEPHDGSFAITDDSKKGVEFPNCEGSDFDVLVRVKWVPSATWKPCKLKWFETSSRAHIDQSIASGEEADLYDRGRDDQRFNASPVFWRWWYAMDASYPISYFPHETEQLLKAQKAWAQYYADGFAIPLNDTPCFAAHTDKQGEYHHSRELSGRVEVHSGGCSPPCDSAAKEANWAQLVRFDKGGDSLKALFFETDSYDGPEHLRPEVFNKGGTGDEEQDWTTKWKRRWKRDRAARGR